MAGYDGYVDTLANGIVFGWAWDAEAPDDPVSVELYIDDVHEAHVTAATFREDLALAGKGNGVHAFELNLPAKCRDGRPHTLEFRHAGTPIQLHGSPCTVALDRRTGASIDLNKLVRRVELDTKVRGHTSSAKPKISVIIPCFNLGDYLDDAVDSVLEQTINDYEIIVVDDGSTDPITRDLLRDYARPRTRIVLSENQGVSGARNLGIQQAAGEYLSFLDADDTLHPEFLEKTLAPLERDPSLAFVSCWFQAFGTEEWTWKQERADLPALLAECTVLTAALVRKAVVDETGGFHSDLGKLFAEDWDFWISIVERGHRGMILPEALFNYRRYADSNSRRWQEPEFVAQVGRAIFARHASSYHRHLLEVLMLKESRIGTILNANYRLEREVQDLEDLTERRTRQLVRSRKRLEEPPNRDPGTLQRDAGGNVQWGEFGQTPVSDVWGFDRGHPVDRQYIETFLQAHSTDIRGDVLEVGADTYTRHFGGSRVTRSAVVDINPENPAATIVADLRDARTIPTGSFDCFIMTQTAYLIYEIEKVVAECARILRPGGVVLATLPCIIRLEPKSGLDADFWRIGPTVAAALFAADFPEQVRVTPFGNLTTAVAFLYGVSREELATTEFDLRDPRFPLIVGVRAVNTASMIVGAK